jgi:hypothetical protein
VASANWVWRLTKPAIGKNGANTSIVWEHLFATDEAGCAQVERTGAQEGMKTFPDSAKVIPFSR